MDIFYSPLPLYVVSAPLIASVLILASGSARPNLRESATIIAALLQCVMVFAMLPPVLAGRVVVFRVIELYAGLSIMFSVDAFGMVFALLASFLWVLVSIYSIGYMRSLNEHAQTRYFFCFALALFGAVGVALSGNLITLYMFYEILSVSTYPLVAHKETPEAIRAGRKYLAYLLGGAVFLLFAMGATYSLTGTLDFASGGLFQGKGTSGMLRVIFACFMIGFGTKAALMPLHEWLPSAMIAPTPVSALLHAVAVVKAGVFCVLRVILYVFGPEILRQMGLWEVLAYCASFTVIVANLIALTQDNLKRRLAFSTINNLAMIILGASLLNAEAVRGAVLLIPFHGFMKITLFMCAGAIYVRTGKELVSELQGIGRQMPVTMGAFTIGAAGLVGLPPVCGLLSKWYLCLGAFNSGEMLFLFVFLASALLDAAYFFPIIYNAYFRTGGREPVPVAEAPLLMTIPLAVSALFSVVLCFAPGALFGFFTLAELVIKTIF